MPTLIRINPVDAWRDSNDPRKRKARRMVFEPNPDAQSEETLNLFRGFPDFADGEGTCDLFIEHVRDNVFRGDAALADLFLDYLAHALQRPWEKPGLVFILRGGEGDGKTIVANLAGRLFGAHHLTLNSADLITRNFNSHLTNAIFIEGNEIFFAGDRAGAAKLKSIITDATIPIEAKYRDVIECRNLLRIVATTNDENPVIAGIDARRYVIAHVGDARRGDRKYFGEMVRQMESGGFAHLRRLLLARDVGTSGVPERLLCAPRTNELAAQKLDSATRNDPVTAVVYQALVEGRLGHCDWAGALEIARESFEEECREWGMRRKHAADLPSRRALGARLRELFGKENIGVGRGGEGARLRVWVLPEIERARELFAKRLGAPSWAYLYAYSEEGLESPKKGLRRKLKK
jgi:hypothetical protein